MKGVLECVLLHNFEGVGEELRSARCNVRQPQTRENRCCYYYGGVPGSFVVILTGLEAGTYGTTGAVRPSVSGFRAMHDTVYCCYTGTCWRAQRVPPLRRKVVGRSSVSLAKCVGRYSWSLRSCFVVHHCPIPFQVLKDEAVGLRYDFCSVQ